MMTINNKNEKHELSSKKYLKYAKGTKRNVLTEKTKRD